MENNAAQVLRNGPRSINLSGTFFDMIETIEKSHHKLKGHSLDAASAYDPSFLKLSMAMRTLIFCALQQAQIRKIDYSLVPKKKETSYQRELFEYSFPSEIQRVLSGEYPERRFRKELLQIFPQLFEIIQKHPDLMICLEDERAFSIVNLRTVQFVMRKHADVFPVEASENPRTWLEHFEQSKDKSDESQPEGEIRTIQYGLISGFEEKSVLDYLTFLKARKAFLNLYHDASEEKKEELDAFEETMTQEEMIEYLNTSSLSKEHKETLTIFYSCPGHLGYFYLDDGAYERHAKNVEERKKHCAVDPGKKLQAFMRSCEQKTSSPMLHLIVRVIRAAVQVKVFFNQSLFRP